MAKHHSEKKLKGFRRGTDMIYGYLLLLFTLLGIVQIFFAGFGAFGHDFDMHVVMGNVLAIVSVLIFIFAILAHRSKGPVIIGIIILLLTAVVQMSLAGAGWDYPWLGGLHALIGVIDVGIAGTVAFKEIRRYTR